MALQVLDGIGAACFGIMVPLIVSDVAARSGHFNLSLGAVGFAIGIGSTLSTSAAGWLADHFGMRLAFYFLTAVGTRSGAAGGVRACRRLGPLRSRRQAGGARGGCPPRLPRQIAVTASAQ